MFFLLLHVSRSLRASLIQGINESGIVPRFHHKVGRPILDASHGQVDIGISREKHYLDVGSYANLVISLREGRLIHSVGDGKCSAIGHFNSGLHTSLAEGGLSDYGGYLVVAQSRGKQLRGACGVLVDGKIYTTLAQAAEVAKVVNSRENAEDRKIKIRSLLTCESEHGVCIKCYGRNLATAGPVTVGEAVGIIAAQSIGEPGTQLTMRTFHTGGVASQADITQGLPRVEELFEGRKPKTLAMLSEIDGKVSFEEIKKSNYVVITGEDDVKKYLIPFDARLCQEIQEGAYVVKGQHLTEGAVNPHDVLAVLGVDAVHNYLIKEVQMTYRMQGVDINDKHIEVIVRQMMRKVKVDDAGSTTLLPGTTIEKLELNAANAAAKARCEAEGMPFTPATALPVLLGITKASLATESFLSAASFQETTRVLTDAAIKGKNDRLIGLKENIMIGKLIPAGTGMTRYRNVEIVTEGQEEETAEAAPVVEAAPVAAEVVAETPAVEVAPLAAEPVVETLELLEPTLLES